MSRILASLARAALVGGALVASGMTASAQEVTLKVGYATGGARRCGSRRAHRMRWWTVTAPLSMRWWLMRPFWPRQSRSGLKSRPEAGLKSQLLTLKSRQPGRNLRPMYCH